MRQPLLLLTVATALAGSPAHAVEPAATCSLWVDPARIDLADEPTVAQLLDQPIQRLVVTGLSAGHTLFPTQTAPFAQMPRYRGKPDPLTDLLARARARGIAVAVALDCLRWADPDTPADENIFARQPELAERDFEGGFGRPGDGKYASPFHPKVRQALRALAEEVGSRYPTLDALVLECRLPAGSVLGYSPTSRDAYHRARKMSPPDIPLGEKPQAKQLAAVWLAWRLSETTALVRDLMTGYRARSPTGRVIITGRAGWHQAPFLEKLAVPSDWLAWAANRSVAEVFLDADWADASRKDAYSMAAGEFARRVRRPVRLSAVLAATEGPTAEAAARALLAQEAAGLVVRAGSLAGLTAAGRFLREELPRLETTPLEMEEVYLKADPRLQAKLTHDLQSPTAEQVLALLREATGLALPFGGPIDSTRPAFDRLILKSEPAWAVMGTLAGSDAVRGRWVRVGKDYQLIGTVAPAEVADPTQSQRSAAWGYGWWGAIGVVPLLLVGGWLLGRAVRSRT